MRERQEYNFCSKKQVFRFLIVRFKKNLYFVVTRCHLVCAQPAKCVKKKQKQENKCEQQHNTTSRNAKKKKTPDEF